MKKKMLILLAAVLLTTALLPLSTAFAAESGTISGNRVNLREGPGTGYDRIKYMYSGDQVGIISLSGGWYKVTAGTDTGYVYAQYVTAASYSSPSSLLRYGSRGDEVVELQKRLITLGYLDDAADGIFGSKTQAAVIKYQRANGLSADGIAGSITRAAVAEECGRIEAVLTLADSFAGLAYQSGGISPDTGFDCSGFVQYVFKKAAGISLPRVSRDQATAGTAVPLAQIRPGDIVAFNSPVSHVGIYVGDGIFIHSPKTGDVVKYTRLEYMNVTAVRRVTGVPVS